MGSNASYLPPTDRESKGFYLESINVWKLLSECALNILKHRAPEDLPMVRTLRASIFIYFGCATPDLISAHIQIINMLTTLPPACGFWFPPQTQTWGARLGALLAPCPLLPAQRPVPGASPGSSKLCKKLFAAKIKRGEGHHLLTK